MLDDYEKRLADGAAFVAEIAGRIAGILVLLPPNDHLLPDNVAADKECQSRGIGRSLIAFAEEEEARRGDAEIRRYTHQTMVENVRMYAKVGYEETGRGKQAGDDRVFMRKTVIRSERCTAGDGERPKLAAIGAPRAGAARIGCANIYLASPGRSATKCAAQSGGFGGN